MKPSRTLDAVRFRARAAPANGARRTARAAAVVHEREQHHFSCMTPLCLTWCSSIGDAPCSTLVSQTPTPGHAPPPSCRYSRRTLQAASTFLAAAAHLRGAAPPAQHQPDRAADRDREPAALDDLDRIGDEKDRVDRAERHDDRDRHHGRPFPSPTATRYSRMVVISMVPETAMP